MNKTDMNALFSNNKDDWETPKWLFDRIQDQLGIEFTLDPCASDTNHKCDKYFTEATNGLNQSWAGFNSFINPPYSQSKLWIKKAYDEAISNNETKCVLLLPMRSDTIAFHEYIMKAEQIHLIKGRIKFEYSGIIAPAGAPFPSAIVVFDWFDKPVEVKSFLQK